MRAGLEDVRLGRRVVRVALEEATEERQFDLLAIELRGLRAEIDVAQLVAIATAPAAVRPRAHHEHVGDAGVHPLGRAICLQRAEQIFRVVPAADGHDGAVDVLEMRADVAGLPVGVVGGVRQELDPFGRTSLEQHLVGIRQRPHAQEEVVAVGRLEVEGLQLLVQRIVRTLREGVEEAEVLRQEECAVVMDVVAHEPVRDRCLRRRGLERRMGIDHPHRGVEAGIGDAEHADVAVVVRHVLHQPVDGVVGVRAFIEILRALGRIERTDVHVSALRAVAPAHVLRDEDELVLRQRAKRTGRVVVVVRAVWLECIRRAREHDGPRLRIVLGHIHAREETYAIAHRNAMLILGVMLGEPDGVGVSGGFRRLGKARGGCEKDGEEEDRKTRGVHALHCSQAWPPGKCELVIPKF